MTKPDDKEVKEALIYDRRITYSQGGRGYSASPKQILMAAARMQRDGWSLKRIRQELTLVDSISDAVLERALARGRRDLEEAIRLGEEPLESEIDVTALLQEEEVAYDDPSIDKSKLWTPGSGNA